jgi:hypothetical protein
VRCRRRGWGEIRDGHGAVPSRAGRPGRAVGATLRGEDGRYFPADRLEVWFNTKVPVSQVPDASPITPGPILQLSTVSDMTSCTFSTHFTVPRVAPGRYKVNVFVFHVGGYGFWLPHFLTVT